MATKKEKEWEYVWKSNFISFSQVIKDAKDKGIDIGVDLGRNSLKIYFLTEINIILKDFNILTKKALKGKLLKLQKEIDDLN